MKVIIGSENPTKVNAVKEVFPSEDVSAKNASSNVSQQPSSDLETKTGAINRATLCVKNYNADIGIGLEGGIMYVDKELYLCNWGALVTRDNHTFTASGARILLPQSFAEPLKAGKELGDLMETYTQLSDVRKNEGAIGIFTNGNISRKEMFVHVVKLLYGQWEYTLKQT